MGELIINYQRKLFFQGLEKNDLKRKLDAIVDKASEVRNAQTDRQEMELARELVELILGDE